MLSNDKLVKYFKIFDIKYLHKICLKIWFFGSTLAHPKLLAFLQLNCTSTVLEFGFTFKATVLQSIYQEKIAVVMM